MRIVNWLLDMSCVLSSLNYIVIPCNSSSVIHVQWLDKVPGTVSINSSLN